MKHGAGHVGEQNSHKPSKVSASWLIHICQKKAQGIGHVTCWSHADRQPTVLEEEMHGKIPAGDNDAKGPGKLNIKGMDHTKSCPQTLSPA